jgi:hypothetical protein
LHECEKAVYFQSGRIIGVLKISHQPSHLTAIYRFATSIYPLVKYQGVSYSQKFRRRYTPFSKLRLASNFTI